jgi:DNA-binding NarL/FixJ family response regulator
MATRILEQFPTVLIPKTCARCGRDFGAVGREYTCPACKDPVRPVKEKPSTPSLSFRERQIVQLIQQAKSNKEIAYELCLTVGTVKEYIYHIFRKLGVGNRTELALWSRDSLTEIAC